MFLDMACFLPETEALCFSPQTLTALPDLHLMDFVICDGG